MITHGNKKAVTCVIYKKERKKEAGCACFLTGKKGKKNCRHKNRRGGGKKGELSGRAQQTASNLRAGPTLYAREKEMRRITSFKRIRRGHLGRGDAATISGPYDRM